MSESLRSERSALRVATNFVEQYYGKFVSSTAELASLYLPDGRLRRSVDEEDILGAGSIRQVLEGQVHDETDKITVFGLVINSVTPGNERIQFTAFNEWRTLTNLSTCFYHELQIVWRAEGMAEYAIASDIWHGLDNVAAHSDHGNDLVASLAGTLAVTLSQCLGPVIRMETATVPVETVTGTDNGAKEIDDKPHNKGDGGAVCAEPHSRTEERYVSVTAQHPCEVSGVSPCELVRKEKRTHHRQHTARGVSIDATEISNTDATQCEHGRANQSLPADDSHSKCDETTAPLKCEHVKSEAVRDSNVSSGVRRNAWKSRAPRPWDVSRECYIE